MKLTTRQWGTATGRLALLVHGGTNASSTWRKVGPWLAGRGWHVLAVDLRGHGRSHVPDDGADASLTTLTADVRETVATLRPDADRVDLLVGHSLGTLVSLSCLTEDPSFASRLVLEDPPGEHFDFVQDDAARVRIEAARSDPAGFAERIAGRMGADGDVDARDVAATVEACAAADPAFASALCRHLSDVDVVGLARRCTVPVLLLVGRDLDASGPCSDRGT